MDFLDPKKKRAHRNRLFVGYVLIGIIIITIALLLMSLAYGYNVDRKTGEIIQNGLVFVDARPESAQIFINGERYKADTDARIVLPSAPYKIELKRAGYRNWQRTFSLRGGSIERFVYPILFPTSLFTKNHKEYAKTPAFTTASPDHHWLLIQQPDQFATFDMVDLSDHKKPLTALTLPVALFTASEEHSYGMVEWSNDNRHMLLEHKFKGGHEFIMVDREQPASSVNINQTLKRNPTQVSLRDKRFDKLYLFDQTAKTLSFADLKAGTVQPLLSNVLAYKTDDNLILYATDAVASAGKVRLVIRENDKDYTLREVAASPPYLLDLARFDNHWYMAAGGSSENRVFVYKDPLSVLKHETALPLVPATVLRVNGASHVSFSDNSRFVAIQNGTEFAVYDAEADRGHHYTLKNVAIGVGQHATWMDGHRLMTVSDGKVVVWDYDGINMQKLSGSLPGSTPYFDRDYNTMYTLAPSVTNPAQVALTKTSLKVLSASDQQQF
jgi:hypothetical protein